MATFPTFSIIVLLGVAPATTAVSPVAGPGTPGELFEDICLADQVQLAAREFRTTDFDHLPAGAKMVIQYSLPPTRAAGQVKWSPVASSDAPNKVLASLAHKDTFVVLPAAGQQGRLAPHCAVIWAGNHYADALVIANKGFGGKEMSALLATSKGLPGMNSIGVQSDGRFVGAAELNGWTIVRIAPDTSLEEQATQ